MLAKTKAIVLNTVRYQEKSLIVNAYTASFGLLSFFIPSAFGNKRSGTNIAFFQPMNVLMIDFDYQSNKNMQRLKEVNVLETNHHIHFDVYKNSQAIFLAEIIKQTIKEHEENDRLFNFLHSSISALNHQDLNADFHLVFMLKLTKFLGFMPSNILSSNTFFDLESGSFLGHSTFHSLSLEDSDLLKKLIILASDETKVKLSFVERKITLKNLLKYYQFHVVGFKEPKSLLVLQEVFEG